MTDTDHDAGYKVGYRQPPLHTRFKPGVSGNPSGRRKGSQNLKTLFHKILNEEVALRDGEGARKITKAEAIMRSLIVGALKGDGRSIGTLFRLAEQSGEFEDPSSSVDRIHRIIVDWGSNPPPPEGEPSAFPGHRDINKG